MIIRYRRRETLFTTIRYKVMQLCLTLPSLSIIKSQLELVTRLFYTEPLKGNVIFYFVRTTYEVVKVVRTS